MLMSHHLLLLFSCSVMFNSLRPHELQHARLSCPSLSPWVCSVSCPLSQWCHLTISPTVVPFSSCFQSVPALGSEEVWACLLEEERCSAQPSPLPQPTARQPLDMWVRPPQINQWCPSWPQGPARKSPETSIELAQTRAISWPTIFCSLLAH